MGWWNELSNWLGGRADAGENILTVDGIEVNVVRKAIKNVHLRVYPPLGKVKVAAPFGFSDQAVRSVVTGKLGWIRRHQTRLQSQPPQPIREFTPASVGAVKRDREQLRLRIPPLIQKWEPILGVKVAAWGVKKMRTRWGSCNTRAARIWLNLALIHKSNQCLEYVVVHEMVHLLEPTHNHRFKGLMNRFFPQWKHCRDELNRAPLAHERREN